MARTLFGLLATALVARSEFVVPNPEISSRGTVVFTDTFDNIPGWDRQGVVMATSEGVSLQQNKYCA